MRATSRRGAIGTFLGLGCAASLPFGSGPALAQTRVAIPDVPMRLSHRLERSLRDGASLSVSRNWQVDFADQGRGISITGVQLDALVEAPDALAALAQIEQNRSTSGMWPIDLSPDGKIMVARNGLREDDMRAAVEEAEQFIADSPLPTSEQEARLQHLRAMQRTNSTLLDQLPNDLFFPEGTPQLTRRAMGLPGGLTGEFEVAYEAKCGPGTAWLESAIRHVTTRIGDNEQRASERWTLAKM